MTHIYESTFHRYAHEWLKNAYGDDNVHHEEYITVERDGREQTMFVDFVVETPMTTWAVEAERTRSKVREGVGQAEEYADAVRQSSRFEAPVTPAILVPHGHSQGEGWARQLVTVKEAPKFDSG